ncbi:hypothetical protein ABZP36_010575 [Zizania latifolia]
MTVCLTPDAAPTLALRCPAPSPPVATPGRLRPPSLQIHRCVGQIWSFPHRRALSRAASAPHLLASSSDALWLWLALLDDLSPCTAPAPPELRSVFDNHKTSAFEFYAPLTSFDWNESELHRIRTASIDTTCTIWDIKHVIVENPAHRARQGRARHCLGEKTGSSPPCPLTTLSTPLSSGTRSIPPSSTRALVRIRCFSALTFSGPPPSHGEAIRSTASCRYAVWDMHRAKKFHTTDDDSVVVVNLALALSE